MLANGPAWTKAGCPSNVCIRLGMSASLSSTVTAPATPSSSRVTGFPCRFSANTTRPTRSRMSLRLVARARIAINSLATVISTPVARGKMGLGEPSRSVASLKPTLIERRLRSHTSTTRFQVILSGSISSRRSMPRRLSASSDWRLSWYMRVSIAAATRLWATLMAWMSPVRCRLKSSIGMIWLYPPPAAPPLMLKVGPMLGWRMQHITFLPSALPIAWVRPTVVVVLPSPSGVGVMAVTSMYLPWGLSWSFWSTSR